jgi:hypothetical protein
MKNLNKVFLVIKQHCGDREILEDCGCVAAVQADLDLDTTGLRLTLDILQNMKLIKFSLGEPSFITLTELGKEMDRINSSV